MLKGTPTLITVAGGSNTVGHGAVNGFPWPRYLLNWFIDAFPNTNISVSYRYALVCIACGPQNIGFSDRPMQMTNGAVAGACSEYMSLCNLNHIPQSSNIIILEYRQGEDERSGASLTGVCCAICINSHP